MKDTYKSIYNDFSEGAKNTFYLNIISIVLIFFFLLGPMKTTGITGGLIRLIIMIILSYSLYITINSSNSLLNIENIFVNPNLASVRTNYILNIILCVSIGLLIMYFFYGIFN